MSADEPSQPPGKDERSAAPEIVAHPERPPVRGGATTLDESRIEAPSRQTLFMLGAVTVSTLVMWAAGRAACNYHVPGESLTPREVALAERTVLPKGVALEFAQALATHRFADAEKLAMDDGLAYAKKAALACSGCVALDADAEKIWSAPEVLPKANAIAGFVRVTTSVKGASKSVVMLVRRPSTERREPADWRVAGVFEEGATLPELPEAPSVPPSIAAVPSSIAAVPSVAPSAPVPASSAP